MPRRSPRLPVVAVHAAHAADVTLLNVSYDPTRELYQQYDAAFAAHWKAKTGDDVTIKQSHGGSGKQARSVIDGLEADVVTLALAYDIDEIAEKAKLIAGRLAEAPAARQLALHVDHHLPGPQGQPEGRSSDWGDLRQAGRRGRHAEPEDLGRRALGLPRRVRLGAAPARRRATPRRATSSPGCSASVPVLDSGARGSTVTFAERGIGDVLLAWENEAHLALQGVRRRQVRDRLPVDQHPRRAAGRGRRQGRRQARHAQGRQAYLEFLYSPAGQEIAAQQLLPADRRRSRRKYAAQFPKIALFTIDEVFGGWAKAQKTHFADGGVFDQIYSVK